MSTTTTIILGIIFAIIWGAAQKKHSDFNAEIESKPLAQDADANVETLTESEADMPVVNTIEEDEEARKAYIIEQKKLRAYEIWALRKKVMPIAWGIIGASVLMFFLINVSMIFGILGFLGFIGATIYMLTQIGSKNQQYTLLVVDLKKEGYSHSELKSEFEQWYYGA